MVVGGSMDLLDLGSQAIDLFLELLIAISQYTNMLLLFVALLFVMLSFSDFLFTA